MTATTPPLENRHQRGNRRKQLRHNRRAQAVMVVVALAVGSVAGMVLLRPSDAGTAPVRITAAGDLGSSAGEISPVADQIKALNPDFVVIPGDVVYPDGQASGFSGFFNQVYGPLRSKLLAVPGNHDYHTSGGSGFYSYFAQPKFFAKDVGNGWRAYLLNCEIDCKAGSAQETFVKDDIAAHPNMHRFAVDHEPRFTSGDRHGDYSGLAAIWNHLANAGGEFFISGHNHEYERFARMNGSGGLDPNGGMRQFVCGSGGNGLYAFSGTHTGSESRNNSLHGACSMDLSADGYSWKFTGTNGTVTDTGTQTTKGSVTSTTSTSPPSSSSTSTTSSTSSSSTSSTSTSSTSSSTRPPSTTTTTRPNVEGCQNLGGLKYGLVAFPFTFRSGTCATNATAWGAWPYATTPWDTFHHTGAFNIKGPGNFRVHDVAAINYGDGFRVEAGGQGFVWDHVYGAYLHDDCFENDWNQGGTIKNSRCESYVIYSAQASAGQGGDGSANTVTLSNNYFELKPTPTVFKGPANLSGPWFKLDSHSPKLVAIGNVFVASVVPPFGTLDAPAFKSCSGNTVIWRGAGDFPGRASWKARCPDTTFLLIP